MDGKLVVAIGLLIVPAALIGITIAWFSSNPVSIFAMIALMILGAFYVLTYRESFG
jgi:hypothetical protein